MNQASLKQKIALLSVLPCSMMGVLLTGFFLATQFSNEQSDIIQRGQSSVKKLASLVQAQLQSGNFQSLKLFTDTFLQEPDINAVQIYAAKRYFETANKEWTNQIISSSGKSVTELSPKANFGKDYTLLKNQNTYTFIQAVYQHNMVVGHKITSQTSSHLSTQLSSKPIAWVIIEYQNKALSTGLYRNSIISGLIIICLVILTSIYGIRNYKTLKNILTTLNQGLERIRFGDLDYQIDSEKHSEFKNLIYNINHMTSAIRASFSDLQSSLEASNTDLRETLNTIEIQNIELDIARKEALEASRIKSEFLANTSHEIRTPLNGIIGFTRLLENTTTSSQQHDYIATIKNSSESLLHIINDILDFSKIEAGKLLLDETEFDIRQTVDEATALIRPIAYDKRLEITQIIEPDIPAAVIGDPLRIKQVLGNLLSNAIKFTPQGKICIHAELNKYQQKQAYITIKVSDTGIGLSEEQQKSVFKAFAQANTSISREFGGTGLGLVIAKRLSEQMGGDLGLESKLNEGSCFWFSLKAAVVEQALAPGQEQLKGLKIALIENGQQCQSLEKYLQFWKIEYKKIQAATPSTIAAELQPHSFDHIICRLATENDKYFIENTIKCLDRHKINTIYLVPHDKSNTELLANKACLIKPVSYMKLRHLLLNRSLDYPAAETPAYRLKQPVSVLAVDDNEANLKLIRTLLEDMNARVCAVSSGLMALEAIKQQDFDIIFMDIQMPELDGVSSTEKIRQLDSSRANTPVIAVTAHALQEEKQRLLKAGLNDYITKPINEQQLYELIINWTQADKPPANKQLPETAQKEQKHTVAEADRQFKQVPVSIQECLKKAKNKPSLAQEMLSMLIAELPDYQHTIEQLQQQQKWPELLEAVHKLHGACCYTGTRALLDSCEKTEKQLKQNDYNNINTSLNELLEAIQVLFDWSKTIDLACLFEE